jgi:hypothetical protein
MAECSEVFDPQGRSSSAPCGTALGFNLPCDWSDYKVWWGVGEAWRQHSLEASTYLGTLKLEGAAIDQMTVWLSKLHLWRKDWDYTFAGQNPATIAPDEFVKIQFDLDARVGEITTRVGVVRCLIQDINTWLSEQGDEHQIEAPEQEINEAKAPDDESEGLGFLGAIGLGLGVAAAAGVIGGTIWLATKPGKGRRSGR